MKGNLRGRLERVERVRKAGKAGLHPRFWDALCGAFPLDQLDSETSKIIELMTHPPNDPDPIEELLRSMLNSSE